MEEVCVDLTLADLMSTPIRFLEARASDQSHRLLLANPDALFWDHCAGGLVAKIGIHRLRWVSDTRLN